MDGAKVVWAPRLYVIEFLLAMHAGRAARSAEDAAAVPTNAAHRAALALNFRRLERRQRFENAARRFHYKMPVAVAALSRGNFGNRLVAAARRNRDEAEICFGEPAQGHSSNRIVISCACVLVELDDFTPMPLFCVAAPRNSLPGEQAHLNVFLWLHEIASISLFAV